MKIKSHFLLFVMLFLYTGMAMAQKTIKQLGKLHKENITTGAAIEVIDNFEYLSGLNSANYRQTKKVNVRLDYTRKLRTDLSTGHKWSYKVKYNLINLDNNTSNFGEVEVYLAPGGSVSKYVGLESYNFSAKKVRLQILAVEAKYNGSAVAAPESSIYIPKDILLTVEIEGDQHVLLNENAIPKLKWNPSNNQVSWGFVNGAKEYDVEWVFIDKEDSRYSSLITANGALQFKEGVRVRTPYNFIEIDPVYPEGKLFFRVRAIGDFKNTGNGSQQLKEGNWFSNNVTNNNSFVLYFKQNPTPGNSELLAFEKDKNWTFQKSFIEGGKQKAIVSYFDGSLRGRQINTRLSSEKTILTGETYFDGEGREALSVLPVPNADATTLKYNHHFNQQDDGTNIEASDYVNNNSFKLSTTTGAGKYYSANNSYGGDEKAFIPFAGGYPFTQTKYERDGRSRPTKISGVGETFKMGSGRENLVMFADVESRELRELFGKNTGLEKYYRKTVNKDANGQSTVTITDLSGKTVATYLTGQKPKNLHEIDGIDPIMKRFNIGSTGEDDLVNNELLEIKTIANLEPNKTYNFNYKDFTGTIFSHETMGVSFCQHCEYEIEVWITDPDGLKVDLTLTSGGSQYLLPIDVPTTTQTLSSSLSIVGQNIVANCSGGLSYTVTDLEGIQAIFTEIGKYKVHKKIKIGQSNFEAFWQKQLTTLSSQLTTKYNAILDQELSAIDLSGCENWCDQNPAECDKIKNGGSSSSLSYGSGGINGSDDNDDMVDYGTATCESYYNQLLNDVAFVNGIEGNEFQRTAFWSRVSVALPSGINGISITLLKDTNSWKSPANAHLIDSWKSELVKSHREYCLYQDCISAATKNWNNKVIQLKSILNWSAAVSGGVIYPAAQSVPSGIGSFPSPYTNTYVDGGLTSVESTKIAFFLKNFANTSQGVISIYQFLSPAYQSSAGINSIYHGLSATERDKKQWKFFLNYYTDLRNRVHRKAITDNCNTISTTQLNDLDEKCIFPFVQDYDPNGTYFIDLTGPVTNDPVTFLNNNGSTALGGVYTNVSTNYPANFACGDIKEMTISRWMNELKLQCAAIVPPHSDYIKTNLETYFDNNCGSQSNPTAVITGAILANPGTSGPIYNVKQRIISLSCNADILNELVEPTWNSMATSVQPCDEINTMIELYKSIHNDRCDNITVPVPQEVKGYSSNTKMIYDHFGGSFSGTPGGPGLKLHAHNNWKYIEWEQPCKYASGNPIFNNVQYFTHKLKPSTGCHDYNNNAGCIIWAFYDKDGAPFNLYHSSSYFSTDYKIVEIEHDPTLPFSNLPSSSGLVGNVLPNRVNNIPSDFIYRELKFTVEHKTSREKFLIYAFGDKKCLSGEFCYSTKNKCKEILKAAATAAAKARYEQFLSEEKSKFLNAYLDQCAKNVKDNILYDLETLDGYYTLYYYDQAGNLVQTVPPKGVKPVPASSFNTKGNWNGTTNPTHNYNTIYRYNGLNKVVESKTPDAGKTHFYYNAKSMIRLSQNSQQVTESKVVGGITYRPYSYTNYDNLGRVKESGQLWAMLKKGSNNVLLSSLKRIEQEALINQVALTDIGANFSFASAACSWRVYGKEQMVRTYYGDEDVTYPTSPITRENIRSRVLSTVYKHALVTANPAVNDYNAASHYSYDELGNVKTLIQENREMDRFGAEQQYKRIDYSYDYLSGNVLMVEYQKGKADQFFHKYEYDEDNRIKAAYTSKDQQIWDKDSRYEYYKHGPLFRTEIGHDLVQGTDNVYTLNGWLKSINSTLLDPDKDVSTDGTKTPTAQHRWAARDGMASTLGYFNNDYQGIGNTHGAIANPNNSFVDIHHGLYNGNIAYMTTGFRDLDEGLSKPVTAYAFEYDQLQRLKNSTDYSGEDLYSTTGNNGWQIEHKNYVANIDYDLNGNIKKLTRFADKAGVGTKMDEFTYTYQQESGANANNKLDHVKDVVSAGVFTNDLDSQAVANYTYDNIGNLLQDKKEHIASIKWTVSGKVKEIIKEKVQLPGGQLMEDIEFVYDPLGNRISKIVKPHVKQGSTINVSAYDKWTITHYVRDASGNVMATYTDKEISRSTTKDVRPGIVIKVRGVSGRIKLGASSGKETVEILDVELPGGLKSPYDAADVIASKVNEGFETEVNKDQLKIFFSDEKFDKKSYIAAEDRDLTTLGFEWLIKETGIIKVFGGTGTHSLLADEHHIYGSSRLGISQSGTRLANHSYSIDVNGNYLSSHAVSPFPMLPSTTHNSYERKVARKRYELSNHLGNVLAVITDKKLLKGKPATGHQHQSSFTGIQGWGHNWRGQEPDITFENGKLRVSSSREWGGIQKKLQTTPGKMYVVSFDLELLPNCDKVGVSVYDPEQDRNYASIRATKSGRHELVFTSYAKNLYVKIERTLGNNQLKEFYLDNLRLDELVYDGSPVEIGWPESDWVTDQGTIGTEVKGDEITWTYSKHDDRKRKMFTTEKGKYYAVNAHITSPINGEFFFSIYDHINAQSLKWQNNGNKLVNYTIPFKAGSTGSGFVIHNILPANKTQNKITLKGGVQLYKLRKRSEVIHDDMTSFDGWVQTSFNKESKVIADRGRLKLILKTGDEELIKKTFKTTPGKYYRIKLDLNYEGIGSNGRKFVITRRDQFGTTYQNINNELKAQSIFLARENEITLSLGANFADAGDKTVYVDNIEWAEMEKIPATTQQMPLTGWSGSAYELITNGLRINSTQSGVGTERYIQDLVTKGKAYTIEADFDIPSGKEVGWLKADQWPHNNQFYSNIWNKTTKTALPFYANGPNVKVELKGREASGVSFTAKNIRLTELRKVKTLDNAMFDHLLADDPILIANRPASHGFAKRLGAKLEYLNNKLKVTAFKSGDGVQKLFNTVPGKYYKLSFDVKFEGKTTENLLVSMVDDLGFSYVNLDEKGRAEALFMARSKTNSVRVTMQMGSTPKGPVTFWMDNILLEEMVEIPGSSKNMLTVNWQGVSGMNVLKMSDYIQLSSVGQSYGQARYVAGQELVNGHYYVFKADFKNMVGTSGIGGYYVNESPATSLYYPFKVNGMFTMPFKAKNNPMRFMLYGRGYNFSAEVHQPELIELVKDKVVYQNNFDGANGNFVPRIDATLSFDPNKKKVRVNVPNASRGVQRSFRTVPSREYEVEFDLSTSAGMITRVAMLNFENKNTTDSEKIIKWRDIFTTGRHTLSFVAEQDHAIFTLVKTDAKQAGVDEYIILDNFRVLDNTKAISNLRFDSYEGWQNLGAGTKVQVGFGGKLKVVSNGKYKGARYKMKTVPGQKYEISYDFTPETSGGVISNVGVFGATQTVHTSEVATTSQRITQTFTATTNETELRLMKNGTTTTSDFFLIDNFIFKGVPLTPYVPTAPITKAENNSNYFYYPDIISYNDYYPFGMLMSNRNANSSDYRYGFNGKEKDLEGIGGGGNTYDYGFRIYNPAIAKFLSVDPLAKSFPYYTPYQFAGNMPIAAIDLDGLEEFVVIRWYDSDDKYVGSSVFKIKNKDDRLEKTGVLIVNSSLDGSKEFGKNYTKLFKDKLFNVDSNGKPISLKGGKIVEKSPNRGENVRISLLKGKHKWMYFKTTEIHMKVADGKKPTPEGMKFLNLKTKVLEENPEYGLIIVGHASNNDKVPESHNVKNSKDRAYEIASFLSKKGISRSRLFVSFKGSSEPSYDNSTKSGREKNRRADVTYTIPRQKKYD